MQSSQEEKKGLPTPVESRAARAAWKAHLGISWMPAQEQQDDMKFNDEEDTDSVDEDEQAVMDRIHCAVYVYKSRSAQKDALELAEDVLDEAQSSESHRRTQLCCFHVYRPSDRACLPIATKTSTALSDQ